MSAPNGDYKPDVKPENITSWSFPVEDDEELSVASGIKNAKVWAVKIPRFLLERWERVQDAGVELGTLVVDNSARPPRITLRLPNTEHDEKPSPSSNDPMRGLNAAAGPSRKRKYDTNGIPDVYEVNVPDERARNSYIFTEKQRSSGVGGMDASGKRKREKAFPKLVAAVDHECMVKPVRNDKYLKILQQRRLESEQTRRPIVQLESTGITQAQMNQLASGFSNAQSTFGRTTMTNRLPTNERFARLDRPILIDRLFALFNDKPYWGIPALKAMVKQPDPWLREVLLDVAEQIPDGQYANMWQLKETWRKVDGEGDGEEEDEDDGEEDDEDIGDEEFEEVLA